MMSKLWVDPPEGWKHGFPAIYDSETDGQMSEWIISKGYPVQTIKEYGEQWHIRCWSAEEPDEKKYPDKDISAQKQSKDVKNAPIGTEMPKKTHRKVTVSEVLEELNFAKLRIQELRDRIDVLEKTEQEPVAYLSNKRQRINIELKPQTFVEIPTVTDWEMPLYMKPPHRTWVGLTDEERLEVAKHNMLSGLDAFAKAIEAKLKEKNT